MPGCDRRYPSGVTLATLILYFTLAYCALGIGLIAARYDLYRKEPWHMILLAVVFGAAAMWAAGRMQVGMIVAINGSGHLVENWMMALMAGGTEELGKLTAVLAIAIITRRHFDEPLDGLIYGSFAGLGAALEESFHILSHLPAGSTLPAQEPVRLAGHLILGGICGYGLGLVVMKSPRTLLAVAASYLAAATLHTFWDVAAFDAADFHRANSRLLFWHHGVPVALMLAGMVAYRVLARRAAGHTREWLQVCDVAPYAASRPR